MATKKLQILGSFGGASVQPNWNQNDETSSDYIKNRPFYTGNLVETELIDVNTSLSESGNTWYQRTDKNDNPIDDIWAVELMGISLEISTEKEYVIYINDKCYKTVATDITSLMGAPFTIYALCPLEAVECMFTNVFPDDFKYAIIYMEGQGIGIVTRSETVPTVCKIAIQEQEIIKIEPKYLPEGGFGYSEPTVGVIIDNQTFDGFESGQLVLDSLPLTLELGQTYNVVWDGDEYNSLVCHILDGAPAIGTETLDFTDVPFAIATVEGRVYIRTSSKETSHTITISGKTEQIHQIDAKYIPTGNDSWDLYLPSGGVGYGDEVLIVDNLSYEDYDNGNYPPCTFIIGEKYTVTIDGNVYSDVECASLQGYNALVGTTVNGEDFGIHDNQGNDLFISSTFEWSTISIVQDSIHKIDAKYLPDNIGVQPDWNQEDESAPDYIKNKPEVKTEFNDITFIDKKTGYEYVAYVYDGTFITCRKYQSIEITTPPDKTEYITGKPFDPTGMVITGTFEDGTTSVITNYVYPETVSADFKIFCLDGGVELDVDINIADAFLVDFEYTMNDDGTYTITGWKETYERVPSTEMIVPDSDKVIL